MNKRDLHLSLQASCVPVPGRSGCFAVVPPLAPSVLDIPRFYGLAASARSELQYLAEAIAQNEAHASLLMHMLNRREAVDSSQIEGTQTSFDGLLLHEMEEASANVGGSDEDAKTTFAYVRAFMAGSRAIEVVGKAALNLDLLCEMHAILMAGESDKTPGKIREVQNYIGLRLETATYIPPPPAELNRLLADLVKVLQYESKGVMEVSILIRAAIAHAQFEAIHPFLDGNGRAGRLILPLMFQAEDLPPIHLATFLKVRQREYYDALNAVQTRLNWEPWLGLFLECVIASCKQTRQLLTHLHELKRKWILQLIGAKKRKHAAVWKVIDLLLGQPVINVNEVVRRTGVSFPAANQAVGDLVALDILRPANELHRHRVFHSHEVLNALYTGLDKVLDQAAEIGRQR